jgi:hypothetical protein
MELEEGGDVFNTSTCEYGNDTGLPLQRPSSHVVKLGPGGVRVECGRTHCCLASMRVLCFGNGKRLTSITFWPTWWMPTIHMVP